jgi:hypothetical protein
LGILAATAANTASISSPFRIVISNPSKSISLSISESIFAEKSSASGSTAMSAVAFFFVASSKSSTFPPEGKPKRLAFSADKITFRSRFAAGSTNSLISSGILFPTSGF